MDYEGKKSGHIPAFGNWDYTNDLPITKYFECARQAGLIPPSSSSSPSSCQCGPCAKARCSYPTDVYTNTNANTDTDDFKKTRIRVVAVPTIIKASKVRNHNDMRPPKVKEKKKEVRIRKKEDLKEQQPSSTTNQRQRQRQRQRPTSSPEYINVKSVDEDLYKIPSNLLHNSSKKMLGFFSRCLVPPCRA